MFDYYGHIANMSEDHLVKEVERLNNQLMKLNPQSPLFNQVLDMSRIAETALREHYERERFKNQKDSVIEIGKMESKTFYPDYTKEELLDVVVTSYIDEPKGNNT